MSSGYDVLSSQTQSNTSSTAAKPSWRTELGGSLRGMSYSQGSAALSTQVQKQEGDGCAHEHERDPDPGDTVPGDLDTNRPVGAAIPDAIKQRLLTELRRSPSMVTLLQEIADNGGTDFNIKWSARGNFQSNGEISLDRRRSITRWLPSMMHELNHLNDHRQGRRPNPRTTESREEFVNTKMGNEIHAHAHGFAALIEYSSDAAATITASAPAGYDEFLPELRAAEEAAGECFSSEQIMEFAETWLEDKYRNEWTTSNSGENYYDYWGAAWDRAHP